MRNNNTLETDLLFQNSYEVFFEQNPLPSLVYDSDSLAIVDVNDAAVRHYGYSKGEFCCMSIKDIRPTKEIPKLLDTISINDQVVRFSNSQLHRKKDGVIINVEVISYSLPSNNGSRLRLVMIVDVTEKHQLHQEIAASESKYKALFENAAEAIFYADKKGNILSVNSKACNLLGYTKEELVGMNISSTYLDEERTFADKRIKELKGKSNLHFERKMVKKDGFSFDVEISVSMLDDGHFQGIVRDVSERKRYTEALRESEKKFRILTETSPSGVFIYQDNRLKYVNPDMESFTGYSIEELHSMDFFELVHPEFRELLKERARRRLKGEDVEPRYEFKMLTKNGEEKWVNYSAGLVEYEGKPAVIGNAFDVTRKKEAELSLRKSEERFRILTETSKSAIFIFNDDGFKYVNPATVELTGFSRKEYSEMKFWDIIHPDFKEVVKERGKKRLNGEKALFQNEVKILTKDGKTKWFEYNGSNIEFEGQPAMLGNAFDITERKNLEIALKESETKYRDLINNSLVGVYVTDLKGNIHFANEAFAKMFDYETVEELCSIKVSTLYKNISDREKFVSLLKESNEAHNLEIEFVKKSGESLFCILNAVLRDHEFISGTILDVTEKKKAEISLQESEARFSAFMDNMPIGIFIKDVQSRFVYLNKHFEEAHGIRALGQTASDAPNLPKYVIDKIAEDDKRALKEGMLSVVEKIPDINGEVRIYNTTKFPINRPGQPPLLGCYQIDNTEKVQAQEELLKSKLEYQSFFEDDLTGDYISKVDGKIIKCNPSFLKIFGFSSYMEAENSNMLDLHIDPQKRVEIIEKLKTEKKLDNVILEMKKKDGKHIHVIENLLGTFNNRGELIEIKAYIIDDTDRKIAEQQLKKLSVAVEQNSASIIITDKYGKIEYVNPKFISETGYSFEEVLGKSPSILKSGHTTADEYKIFWETILSGNEWHGEILNRKKNGKLFWESISVSSIKDGNGTITNFVAVQEDITLQREAKEKIKFLALALENINESVAITDPNNILIYVNRAFCKEYGYSEKEIIGKHISTIISDKNEMGNDDQLLQETLKGGWKGELICRRKNREEFPAFLSTSAILNEDGTPSALIGVSSDITERKKVEETLILAKKKAEEMNRIKDIFFANMSHELRTPLIGILGYADLIKNEAKKEEITEMADVIYESGKRLNETLNLILDLSKIETIGTEIHLQLKDINKIIRESEKLFRAAAAGKNLDIIILPGDTNIYANVDEEIFMRVMNNLLSNAIKYTDKGAISIHSFISDNKVKVIIADTGIGISEADQKKIFEPFRQVSEGTSRKFEGTGLGLTITKKYVELMHGNISVKSNPDEGASFIIELPVPLNDKVVKSESDDVDTKKKRLLLVENDAINNRVILSFLEDNYKVDSVFNGRDAVKKTMENLYDCILMDIGLEGDMDGLQTAKKIKENHQYINTPIMAITAYAMKEDREKFLSEGCTHYLPKPFSKEQINKLLNKILS